MNLKVNNCIYLLCDFDHVNNIEIVITKTDIYWHMFMLTIWPWYHHCYLTHENKHLYTRHYYLHILVLLYMSYRHLHVLVLPLQKYSITLHTIILWTCIIVTWTLYYCRHCYFMYLYYRYTDILLHQTLLVHVLV